MKYTGTDKNVVVPNGVTRIGAEAFKENHIVTSVTLPESVTAISDNAFYQCSFLTSINLEHVTSIDDYAFYYCYSLESVTLSNNLDKLGIYSFAYSGLTTISIPKSITSIPNGTFFIQILLIW